MSGKHNFTRDAPYGFIEADAFFFDPTTNCFQHRKSAVAFIQVKDAGGDSHGSKGAKSPDAEEQFLADTYVAIAAVQARGERAVVGSVALNIGIKKEQIAAANTHPPYPRTD